jgi:hypothetical protein
LDQTQANSKSSCRAIGEEIVADLVLLGIMAVKVAALSECQGF